VTSPATDDRERQARVILACLFEPGKATLGRLLLSAPATEIVERLIAGEADADLQDVATPRLNVATAKDLADKALAQTERIGARCLIPGDAQWPHQLADLRRISNTRPGASRVEQDTYPPVCLWARGEFALAEILHRSVSIVGARAATPYGEYVAREFGYGIADSGWTVLSGGAFGVDAAAHRGALTAGMPTIAVLASGVDRFYPAGNAGLLERIVHEGLILSEWPPGADPHRHRFLIRNRVIAAATRGTVVVEAAARSGAINTLTRAKALRRAAMAVPGPITSVMSIGCHTQLRGPGVRLVTSAAEILEEVGRIGDDLAPVPRAVPTDRDRLSPAGGQVLDAVGRQPSGIEAIAATAGVSLRTAMQCLSELMLYEFVERTDAGYRLAQNRRKTVADPD
jgi:DNA processing protein